MASKHHPNKMKEINLILLGKPGEGKSSTGNTILGRSVFQTSTGTGSKSSICTLECSEKDKHLIRVIDTPGFFSDNPSISNDYLMSQAVSLCPGSIDAFILVIQFGNKFTSNDMLYLKSLKTCFGENFTRKSGMIVFTHCDYYESHHEQESPTMKEWVDQTIRHGKDAPFAQLLEMFNYRYVLFYNTEDLYSEKREQGVAKLFEMIHEQFFNPSIPRSIKTEKLINSPKNQVLSIILLGKTGNGKSATGNTILGFSAFTTSGSMESTTKLAQLQCTEVDGKLVRVVDTPGLMDTKDPIKATISQISQAMSFCPEGFSALIFVLKYSCRFTDEERKTLEILKQYFGINFLKDHGIIVMTNGEGFDIENDETKLTYKDWLKFHKDEQFSKLIHECSNRFIMMHNIGQDKIDKRKQSRDELFRMIREELPIPYKSEHFFMAKRIRDIIENFQGPLFNRRIQEYLSMLICQIDTDIQNNTMSFEETIDKFEKLYKAVSDFSIATNRKSLKEKLEIIQERFLKIQTETDARNKKCEQLSILNDLKALKDTPDSVNCFVLKAFDKCAKIFMALPSIKFNERKQHFENKCEEIKKKLQKRCQSKMMPAKYKFQE